MSHPSDLSYTNNAQVRAEQEADSLYDEANQEAARAEVLRKADESITVLQQRLNEDVARLIVLQEDLLLVWRERQRPSPVLSIMELNSPQPCFISSKVKKLRPIRRIEFRIEAHDQGWVTQRDSGSWSWFDVCVLPESDTDVDGGLMSGPPSDRTWDTHQVRTQTAEPAAIFHNRHEVSSLATRERVLCYNSIASRDFEAHTISWAADSEDADEAAWVQSLQPGERVMVRAWARYGGWSNHIRSVSMNLYTVPPL